MNNRTKEQWAINHDGKSWEFSVNADGVYVAECAGPFRLPVRTLSIPPEIHLSFCKCLKAAARAAAKDKR